MPGEQVFPGATKFERFNRAMDVLGWFAVEGRDELHAGDIVTTGFVIGLKAALEDPQWAEQMLLDLPLPDENVRGAARRVIDNV